MTVWSTKDPKTNNTATSVLSGDNPSMPTLRGFENLGLGFNMITNERTRNIISFSLPSGFEDGSLRNLHKEDFFHDVVTDPGTAAPEDCHEFDTMKVPPEVQILCEAKGEVSETHQLFRSENEYYEAQAFSMGIKVLSDVVGGAFALDKSRSYLSKEMSTKVSCT